MGGKKKEGGQVEPVVWEAHISELARRDARWSNIWALFLTSCTIPEDVSKFPGMDDDDDDDVFGMCRVGLLLLLRC